MGGLGFLTMAAFAFIGISAYECPDAWVHFKGSCYLFSHGAETFVEAEHFCLQHQSHLVRVDDSDEDSFLRSHCGDLKTGNRWIGLTDADIEGVWRYTDGSSPDYISWYPGQPNGGKAYDCTYMYSSYGYRWDDVACTTSAMPICEKAISQTPCQPDGGLIIG